MFTKILNDTVAMELHLLGFPFTTETINKNLTIYVFESTPEFLKVFKGYKNFISKDCESVSEDRLRF